MSEQSSAGAAPMPPAPESAPVPRGQAPSTVLNAVRLMYVEVVLGILGIIATFASKDHLKRSILKKQPHLTADKLDQAVTVALVFTVVVGVVFIVLYLLMAMQVRKGKNWARIVTWVLAGLGVLSLAGIAGQPGLNVVLSVLGAIVDLVIIVLLALKASSTYFSAPAPA